MNTAFHKYIFWCGIDGWTFRIIEIRFKYPAKLTIIHQDKIDKINLLDIKITKNGLS